MTPCFVWLRYDCRHFRKYAHASCFCGCLPFDLPIFLKVTSLVLSPLYDCPCARQTLHCTRYIPTNINAVRAYCACSLVLVSCQNHHGVMKWKHFSRYWPFVRGIHQSPVDPPHNGQWRGALMLSLIRAWTHGWVNNPDVGDLRNHRAHYDVTLMLFMLASLVLIQRYVHSSSDKVTLKNMGNCVTYTQEELTI